MEFTEINDPNFIEDNLWISCLIGAGKIKEYPRILAVVSIGPDKTFAENYYPKFSGRTYHYVFVEDDEKADILQYLDEATEFIHNHKDVNVLVHCAAGMSRSATVCIAYLIRYKGYSLNYALEICKKARPIVCPNKGFMEQLKVYENKFKIN
jgi:protein-tyrosine phosphatase